MKFNIEHTTTYHYSIPVKLGMHVLRLRPRNDAGYNLMNFEYLIDPLPALYEDSLDAEGNSITHVGFNGDTTQLTITSQFELQTIAKQPANNVSDSKSLALPIAYPHQRQAMLSRYLGPPPDHHEVVELANDIATQAGARPIDFLDVLTNYIYRHIQHAVRDTGGPQTPTETLHSGKGACRDIAVLFMAVCRVQGMAARFVSGYQAKPAHANEQRYMHAWPEVYIPGAGWRGYDPTHNLIVNDQHVAVAAAYDPVDAAPIEGNFSGAAGTSTMSVQLNINSKE